MSEFWDVTDSSGVPTGETHRRGDSDWPAGRFHVVVATCVQRPDGTVLLTQRAAAKEFGLDWEFPGGSALAGERSVDAAVRELREETSLVVAPDDLQLVGRFAEATALLDLYLVGAPAGVDVVPDPAEVVDHAWVSPVELQRRLDDGLMAHPWTARLDALGMPLLLALAAAR
ncbi:NUDIX hydrolase [Microbacterium gorillae]|uniref:NUDIX hydrolase n=1 Tax=Microbacterium gorillae TaxID=1231063 RepID=UPI000694BAD9|nr:NUDIX hydrolase [Microbacterium gorillae]